MPSTANPAPTMNAREKPSVSAPGSAECAPCAACSRLLVREVATVALALASRQMVTPRRTPAGESVAVDAPTANRSWRSPVEPAVSANESAEIW
jgi:hypothetical protein